MKYLRIKTKCGDDFIYAVDGKLTKNMRYSGEWREYTENSIIAMFIRGEKLPEEYETRWMSEEEVFLELM